MFPITISHVKWICILFILMVVSLKFDPSIAGLEAKSSPSPTPPLQTLSLQTAPISSDPLTAEAKPAAAMDYRAFPKRNDDLSKYTAVEVVATGYFAGKESTGKEPGHPEYGVTYSGLKVQRNKHSLSTIAADPTFFPIGSLLYIPGYGYGVVADTGSAIKGNRIDLYFETKDQVYKEWGKKTLNVFIVKKGAGKITTVMWNQLESELLL